MTDTSQLGFINAPDNRAAGLRGNSKWLARQLADPASKVVVFIGDRPAISIKGPSLEINYWTPQSVLAFTDNPQFVLLHLNDNDQAVFAVELDESLEDQITSDDVKLIDLRSLARQATLPTQQLGALAQARSLLSWHGTHQFCAACGAKTVLSDAGYRRDCNACNRQHFPRVDPVVIMLVQHGERFLMGRGHNFEENHFSALAGFLEPGETIEAATRREVFEETGVRVKDVTYLTSQPWPFPSTLMIGVIAEALTTEIVLDHKEMAEAKWFSFAEVHQMLNGTHPKGTTLPPPMSIAYQMIKTYMKRS